MTVNDRKNAFEMLGRAMRALADGSDTSAVLQHDFQEEFDATVTVAEQHNGWFTRDNTLLAVRSIGASLEAAKLETWLGRYEEQLSDTTTPKAVGIVMAGNLPLVGFHDYLCTLIAGHKVIAKLSAQDRFLLPFFHKVLLAIEPRFEARVEFLENKLQGMDAVIATGSNNTARYFEHYFGKYPNIIRKNRTSVAVLTDDVTEAELKALATDVFAYFGLGCRSVSKVFMPADFDTDRLFQAFFDHQSIIDNNKYANNYDYNRAIYLMERIEFLDNGFLLLREHTDIASPVGTLHCERYADANALLDTLASERDNIQCIVSKNDVPFGKAQEPELWDYADGVDTMAWLLGL